MARTKRQILEFDLRPAVEFVGLDKAIEQIGEKEIIERLDKKHVLEQMDVDDILKRLSPAKRHQLLRRLNAGSAK
jgi:hypothetical protein